MELVFGMPVIGRDGDEAGALDRVLVDPGRREVTHIVVKSAAVSEDVLLPLSLVQGNSDGRLLLHAATGDLATMPRYYEGRTSSPPAGRVDTAVVREPGERRADLEAALAIPAPTPPVKDVTPSWVRVATSITAMRLASIEKRRDPSGVTRSLAGDPAVDFAMVLVSVPVATSMR